jgi:CheY-like chemotaxis protein
MSVLVLVVDDELDVADLFRQQFRRELRAGLFVMEFAYSAREALVRITRPSDINLILLLSDINMPGMTGLELLPKVHEIRPDVPVVMITAYGDEDTRARALKAGAAGFLTKPIDFTLLREEITERLNSFKSSVSG